MDLHLFDLNLLVALDALLTEKNVTRAGNRLNLSQSAMSGALGRLRQHFHDELLVPAGRQMILTPLAEGLVAPVREILLQVRGTLGSKPHFDPATSTRHLSLAVSDYVTDVVVADVLRVASHEAPNITFELRPVGRQASEALESGDLDFLIAPEGYGAPSQPAEVLFEDSFSCVIWSGNSSVGDTLSLDQYLSLGHVVVNVAGNEPPMNYDERFLRAAHLRRRVSISVPAFSMAPALVVGTDRVATIATRLATKYAQVLPLRVLPLPVAMPPMVEMLQWHRVRDDDPAHRWFRRLLERVGRELGTSRRNGPPPTATSQRRLVRLS